MKKSKGIVKSSSATLLCCLLLFYASNVRGQINYVLNPSLEDYWRCPNIFDEIKFAKYWSPINDTLYSITDSLGDPNCSPEYCNVCGTFGVPQSGYYYHYAHSGNGMAEVQMFFDSSFWPMAYERDYLQGRLYKPLIQGKNYCVTFYVTLEQASGYAINHIGAYLDNGLIDTAANTCGQPQTQYTPQIVETAIINDTLNWIKVEGSFIANGTERFITISNFFDKAHTSYITLPASASFSFSWYLVDDVSVIESDQIAFAGNDTTIALGDSVFLGEIAMPYVWYDIQGNVIDSTSGGIWVKPALGTTEYVVKQTLCGVVTWDTVTITVPVDVKNVEYTKNMLVYPNPMQNEFVIENAENTTATIFDIVGRTIYRGVINQKKETINTKSFSEGTYFLEITNGNGERIIKIVKQ